MKQKNQKKQNRIIKYCLLAFCITCAIGGVVLWGVQKWKQGAFSEETFLAQKHSKEGVIGEGPAESPEAEDIASEHSSDENGMAQVDAAGGKSHQEMAGIESEADLTSDASSGGAGEMQNDSNMQTDMNQTKEVGELSEIITDEKGELTLVFGGDICFYDPYANMGAYRERGSDIEKCISSYLLDEMRNADICMVNNEFSYSDRGAPLEGKMYTFRSKPDNVNILRDMGVDIVSVANNHAYDYGKDAFIDTLEILENADVRHVGGGENLEEASKPVFITKNNLTVGYVAATQIERNDSPDTKGATENAPGVLRCYNQSELDHFLEVVRRAKEQCDFLVVYIHWGTENTSEPDWAQPQQAQLISQAGADIIVGCHPHCLQGLTVMNDVPVIYSLGNYWFNSKTVDTALLKLTVNGDGIKSLQMIAAQQAGCFTGELAGSGKDRVVRYLQSLSPEVTFDPDGFVTW